MLISWLVYFFIFVLGAIVGSFLNVVALRYNTGLSIISGRSECFSCGKALRWFELIPIVSFFALKGRCSNCGSKISWQYVLVEILTAFIFLGVFWKVLGEARSLTELLSFYWAFLLLIYWAIWSILIVIVVYDLKHKIIPDGLVFSFSGLALLSFLAIHFVQGLALDTEFWLDLSAGPILFVFFALFWLLSGGRLMGFGDAKLALGMGFFLGFVGGIYATVFAFWIGALVGVSIMLSGKILKTISRDCFGLFLPEFGMKSEIPFAPFLIMGTVISFSIEFDLLGIFAFLSF